MGNPIPYIVFVLPLLRFFFVVAFLAFEVQTRIEFNELAKPVGGTCFIGGGGGFNISVR